MHVRPAECTSSPDHGRESSAFPSGRLARRLATAQSQTGELCSMAATEKSVLDALKTVKDPELNLNLVVLGLVYEVTVEGAHVHARISLTSPMCPAAEEIVHMAEKAILGVEGVESAKVQITFDPPWTPERIPPLIRSSLGL
ncbi:MAG: DUF59 domain-containing protein [Gemmatimonadetes bacterium]|nr:DUF59 domain-containing protein [Gemmatimonadota bacterium]